MAVNTLKEALRDCLINFDYRVMITDLLDEYGVNYEDAELAVKQYIEEQEKELGSKYKKRFMVHGKEADSANEVYTVVEGETQLAEWLAKLRDAESSLYSVEVAGGARSAAPIFKPMQRCAVQLQNIKLRADADSKRTNGFANSCNGTAATVKAEPKAEVKKAKGIENFTVKASASEASSSSSDKDAPKKSESQVAKKSPTETKMSSPEEKKTAQKPTANKKGINSFFSPNAASGGAKKTATSGAIKPPTPKKLNDFFKKQEERKAVTSTKQMKIEPNASIQLFSDDNDSEPPSSDEEEKLSALKRDIITTSDHGENNDDCDEASSSTTKKTQQKRRRIVDTDDEDEAPQQKQEKKDENEDAKEQTNDEEKPPQSETYFDEDSGFVITVKSKKSHEPPPKKSTANKISPPDAPKTKSTSTGKKPSPPVAAAKTKQGNIMNFFSKK